RTRRSRARMHGPGEPERGALAGGGVDRDRAAHALDGLLDDGEPDAGPLDLVAGAQRLEELEDALVVSGVDAGTVVGDLERDEGGVPVARGPHHHAALAGPVVMAYGVVDQVAEDQLEGGPVRDEHRERALDLDAEPRRRRQQVRGLPDDLVRVHALHLALDGADAGVDQQPREQSVHAPGAIPELGQVPLALGRQGRAGVLGAPASELDDAAERAPEVVGGDVGELGELAVAPLELGRARGGLAYGGVAGDAGEDPPAVDHGLGDRQVQRERRAVLASARDLSVVADGPPVPRPEVVLDVAVVLGAVRLRHQHAHVLPDELVGLVAEDRGGGRVRGLDAATLVDRDDAVDGAVDRRAQPRLARRELGRVGALAPERAPREQQHDQPQENGDDAGYDRGRQRPREAVAGGDVPARDPLLLARGHDGDGVLDLLDAP